MIENNAALRALLDPLVPVRDDSIDWDDVLTRAERIAEHEPVHRGLPVNSVARTRSTLLRRVAWLAPAVVTLVAVAAAVALWPAGSRGSVLERAMDALGTDPIVHVVYRQQVHETLIDLKNGKQTQLYEQLEQWYEPGRGEREVDTFDGRTVDAVVKAPANVSSEERQSFALIIAGYQHALANQLASFDGRGTVAGRPVYWISFPGAKRLDTNDDKEHTWSQEIAIDTATYKPVYARQTLDGKPVPDTGQKILSIETLPDGSIDFTPTPTGSLGPSGAMILGWRDNVDVTSTLETGAGAHALGTTPLLVGPSYHGLPLAFAQTQTVIFGALAAPQHANGLELCYGDKLARPPLARRAPQPMYCNTVAPHVLLQESRNPTAYLRDTIDRVVVPDGALLIEWGGRSGYLERDGLYVHIFATSEAEVVAVARALRPIR